MELAKIFIQIVPVLENLPAQMISLHSWPKTVVNFVTFAEGQNVKTRNLKLTVKTMIEVLKSVLPKSTSLGQSKIATNTVDFAERRLNARIRTKTALCTFHLDTVRKM